MEATSYAQPEGARLAPTSSESPVRQESVQKDTNFFDGPPPPDTVPPAGVAPSSSSNFSENTNYFDAPLSSEVHSQEVSDADQQPQVNPNFTSRNEPIFETYPAPGPDSAGVPASPKVHSAEAPNAANNIERAHASLHNEPPAVPPQNSVVASPVGADDFVDEGTRNGVKFINTPEINN